MSKASQTYPRNQLPPVIDLATWSQEMLRYWMKLAKLRDTFGLPVDLIYYVARERDRLPTVINKDGTTRAVTEEEFNQGLKDCLAICQGKCPKGADFSVEQINAIRSQVL